jgi:undecaprenyl phosphate-alpha-L-ara4N flippase subunit ArnE
MLNSLKKNAKGIALMTLCAICLAGGQLIWKLMPQAGNSRLLYLLGGFIIYGCGALSMLLAYRFGELSVLQPMNSLSYVFALIFGASVLGENIGVLKIMGVAIIIVGVVFIGGGSES